MRNELSENGLSRNLGAFYRLGAIVAIIALGAGLLDIILSMIPGWGVDTVPHTAAEWFIQLNNQPLLGLRNLDLINLMVALISIMLYGALFTAMKEKALLSSLLGLVFFALGTFLFFAYNGALAMMELSKAYATAAGDEKKALEAAAYAVLAKARHGSLGNFWVFFLSEIGTLFMVIAMAQSAVFSKALAWLGLGATISLLIYTLLDTFVPGSKNIAMAIVVPGGLAMMVWNALVARQLWALADGKK
ncbi:MAG: DUF4386 family protein [Spirochaetales bacterium]|nr:DUF4386 family protein [Spirochaetales bacterium]